MPRSLKLIQISDLHLRANPDEILHGWHVENAWRRIADDVIARHPDADLWVLTGDLVDDETTAGYVRLNTHLTNLGCRTLALAGNHDDPSAMEQHLTAAQVHQSIKLRGWRIIALNSHIRSSDAGRLGKQQLHTLQSQLTTNQSPTVICIHHPPIPVNSHWIDVIGLHDKDELQKIIRKCPHVAAVICGHAHQAMETEIGGAKCWVTPSTMRQFRPESERFTLDEQSAPGYRIVTLHGDGRASSTLQRIQHPVDNYGDNSPRK